jgi:NADH:ubiquinone oxidoreductase subunit 3 (subunit A)
MNKEKKKALIILAIILFIAFGIPILFLIVIKPVNPSLEGMSKIAGGIFLIFIGVIGIYIAWKFKWKK